MTIDQAMQLAVHHYHAGHLAEAENLCRQILVQVPTHPDAVHLLGVTLAASGHLQMAIELLLRAIALRPLAADFHANLAEFFRRNGQLDQAIATAHRATQLQPKSTDAHINLALASYQKGQLDQATAACLRVLQINPDHAQAHNTLGMIRFSQLQLEPAIESFRKAIGLQPHFPEAHANLVVALRKAQRIDEAVAAARRAISILPNHVQAHRNLAGALAANREFEEALIACRRAVELAPGDHTAYCHLASVHAQLDQRQEAQASLARALQIKPDYAEAHNAVGVLLNQEGQWEQAAVALGRALQVDPQYADAHVNLGIIHLLQGQFHQGWSHYRWRTKLESAQRLSSYRKPMWEGQDLAGKTILLHGEQGLGDTMQFVRYAGLVAGRGGDVHLEVPIELARLLAHVPGTQSTVTFGQPLPKFDLHCPLLNLPVIFDTDLQTIPAPVGYIQPDPDLVKGWEERLGPKQNRMRVGLAWAGNPNHLNDRSRSLALKQLAPLAQIPRVDFYSLQKGESAAQIGGVPELKLIDYTPELNDLADTAALIANLDLVISIDSAIAHLAGAMGKPTWLLIGQVPDWRWMLEREDSPWYPTMRLFRQAARGDWMPVIQTIATELDLKAGGHRKGAG